MGGRVMEMLHATMAARRSRLFVSCSVDHVVEEAEAELTVQLSLLDNVFILFFSYLALHVAAVKKGIHVILAGT
jgi:hypothetical protein